MGEKQKLNVRTEKLGVSYRWGSDLNFCLFQKGQKQGFYCTSAVSDWGAGSVLSRTRDNCQDLSLRSVLQKGKQK